ncbi:UDP-glycosyltransferase 73B4-like [Macadamia integrifolia]|uniref:UDP-glycosyltransferase 73B4-like n=1 Tax=Macadamia integrifolia TaxID=60698 RepID=UPI001C4E7C20|nr:UDP-glycosyltransferase 73B4-like [Macadamia integrifolia]
MASPSPLPDHHLVIFPFMAQGHTLPLLDLSKALARRRLKITIITTPYNATLILPYISKHKEIYLIQIPFPDVEGLPKGCENTSHFNANSMDQFFTFIAATAKLQQPFQKILQEMSEAGDLPIGVISDMFLGWTLPPCHLFGVPRLVFHGMSVLALAIGKTLELHEPHMMVASHLKPLPMPGLSTLPFTLTWDDLPPNFQVSHHDTPFHRFLSETKEFEENSWGVVVNSFIELEGEYLSTLESFYRNGAKAWCVGPVSLYNDDDEGANGNDEHNQSDQYIIKWLDEQQLARLASVIYVSFGTQAHVSDMQLDEIATGLEMSGQPFIWVIRSKTWSPPEGLEERVKGRGLIVSHWVDQRQILAHNATGGFLSHCGWNSVLEGLSRGVPILAWPMLAEQPFNAKFVVDGLGVGLSIVVGPITREILPVGCEAICDGVRELMIGEKGKKAREKAEALGLKARQVVQKGGSSDRKLDELIECLSTLNKS